jgi:hypothetical protein
MTRILSSIALSTGLGFVGWVSLSPHPASPSAALKRDAEVGRQESRQAEPPAPGLLEPRTAVRLWKLTVALKLDQKAASRLFAVFTRFDARLAVVRRERRALIQQLREIVPLSNPDDSALAALIDSVGLNRERENAIEQERFASLRQELTLPQQARLLLLLPRLNDGFRRRFRYEGEKTSAFSDK